MAVSTLGLQRLGDYGGVGTYFALAITNAGQYQAKKLGGIVYCVVNASGEFRVRSEPLWAQGDLWQAPALAGANEYRWYAQWRYPGIAFSVFSDFTYLR